MTNMKGEEMATPIIKVDMNQACTNCGQRGTTEGGLCFGCISAKIASAGRIGQKTVRAITDQVEGMLQTYLASINHAYALEEKLAIGFTSVITPGTGGDLILTTRISFIESRVKDETEMTVNEDQIGLFEEDSKEG